MTDLAPYAAAIATRILGSPNNGKSNGAELRFGTNGSVSVVISGENAGAWYDHEREEGGGLYQLIVQRGGVSSGEVNDWLYREFGVRYTNGSAGKSFTIAATYDYYDESGQLLFQVCRLEPKDFRQRRPNGAGGWEWKTKGTRKVLYRLPQLLTAPVDELVFIVEGEKDADRLTTLGFTATTNPGGAARDPKTGKPGKPKWHAEFNKCFQGRRVIIIPDNDEAGRAHARSIANNIVKLAASVSVVDLPGVDHKGDVSDWLDAGHTREELLTLANDAEPRHGRAPNGNGLVPTPTTNGGGGAGTGQGAPPPDPDADLPPTPAPGATLDDFHAYLPAHKYIYVPTRELWPADSINDCFPPVQIGVNPDGKPIRIKASVYLAQTRPVEQMFWFPSPCTEPPILRDLLVNDGGFVQHPGATIFNLYIPPPSWPGGNPEDVKPWLDHIRTIYPGDVEHIVRWFAHRVQKPWDKINHALVLGGPTRIGKDTMVEPVKRAIGHWNFKEATPVQVMDKYNDFTKGVILRINETRDLGEYDRYSFYDHMKPYLAAPPDVLRVNEKYKPAHPVFNVVAVIETTNHKAGGMHLPADDARHYVAWSESKREDFSATYFDELWTWLDNGGTANVAAYLAQPELLAGFKPKAPPPRTAAFWDFVNADVPTEEAELRDVLETIDAPSDPNARALYAGPDIVTLGRIAGVTGISFGKASIGDWLIDRRNSRQVPHRMEACGYVPVRNPTAITDGLWRINGKRQVVYGKATLTRQALILLIDHAIKQKKPI